VVGSEQWVTETGMAVPPTRVFFEKRLQAVENKGNECGKERKETTKRRQAGANTGVGSLEHPRTEKSATQRTRSEEPACAGRHRVHRGG
jgi:hypothetical protein